MDDNDTLIARFRQTVGDYGNSDFLYLSQETARYYQTQSLTLSYQDAYERVEALESSYRVAGVATGTRVALALDNRPEFFLHFLALNAIGSSVVPLNAGMQDSELAYLIEHSESALLVAHESHHARFLKLAAHQDFGLPVVLPETLGDVQLKTKVADDKLGENTEAAIIYTSGTTGTPKGCILSNQYFRQIGKFYTELGGLCEFRFGQDRIITPLPVSHMNALATSFMGAIESGSCLIQLDRFHPSSYWQTVRESRASIIHYLGVMPALLLNADESSEDNIGDLVRFGFGAGCDPLHHQRFEKRFGFPLIEAWAMSETGAGAWITASHEPRNVGERCFGKAPAGLEYRLVDEAGNDVADGEVGELLVRREGDNPREYFFSGYLKNDAATDEAWQGGWLHTGDEVRVDKDGSFFFVDRRKNIIRRSGENIAALEVEAVLLRHPLVVNCVVCPVADELRGEEVAALIIAKEDESPESLAQTLFEFAARHLVYYKIPGYFVFLDELPLTASAKVKRGDVKKLAAKCVSDGDCIDLTASKRPVKKAATQ